MATGTNRGGINHPHPQPISVATVRIVIVVNNPLQTLQNPLPCAILAPAVVAVETGRVRTLPLRQIAPRNSAAQHKEDPIQNATVLLPTRPGRPRSRSGFDLSGTRLLDTLANIREVGILQTTLRKRKTPAIEITLSKV